MATSLTPRYVELLRAQRSSADPWPAMDAMVGAAYAWAARERGVVGTPKAARTGTPRKLPVDEVLVELYVDRGLHIQEIAATFSASQTTVRDRLQRAGVWRPVRQRRERAIAARGIN